VTLAVAVSAGRVRLPLPVARVRAVATAVLAAERVRAALISVAFVSSRAIAQLNRDHLGVDGPTDVIAFSLQRSGRRAPLIGDIYIAPSVARAHARRHGVTQREELVRLVVHGVLHVLGHDHPVGDARVASRMWRRQEQLVRRLTSRSASR
jgi:probable rRNA maturation factor